MSDEIKIPRELVEPVVRLWEQSSWGRGDAIDALFTHLQSQLHPPREWRVGDVVRLGDEVYLRWDKGPGLCWIEVGRPGACMFTDQDVQEHSDYHATFLFNIEDERQAREKGPLIHFTERECQGLVDMFCGAPLYKGIKAKARKALDAYREREVKL